MLILGESLPGLLQHVGLLTQVRRAQQEIGHPTQLVDAKRLSTDDRQKLFLVAHRQPNQLARCAGTQQTQSKLLPRFGNQLLDERQASAYPALVTAQKLSHLHLAQPVFTNQSMNDPGFL
jgi:hypothetical protein